jgi:hypothetical protein
MNSSISRVRSLLRSSDFSSSSLITTYWSRAYSKPLTRSALSTGSLQVAHTYCCLSRDLSFACSMLNDTLLLRLAV